MLRIAVRALMLLGLASANGQADVVVNVQFGAATTAAEVGAAVVGSATDQWNLVKTMPGSTGVALNNTAGVNSGITLKSSGNTTGTGFYYSATGYGNWSGSSIQNLMSSYFWTSSTTASTFTFSGLSTTQIYEIYVYTQTDVNGERLSVSLNGVTPAQTANSSIANPNNQLILNTNYLVFSNKNAMTGGVMTLDVSRFAGANSVLNGIQIVAVPEPGTLLLGGIAAASGGAGVWWRRRKPRPAPSEPEPGAAAD